MLPSLNVLIVALLTGILVVGVVALVREIRGVVVDPTRPPSVMDRFTAWIRKPAVMRQVGLAAGAGVGALLITRWPVLAAGAAGLVLLWPTLFGGRRAEELELTRLEALVIFAESLRDTIAAHASLEHAIPAAAEKAPLVLRPPLVRLVGQLRSKVPMDRALAGLAAELDDPTADRVLGALILNSRRRGNQLVEVLSDLATMAREELDLRRKVAVGRRSIRTGSMIVVVITVGMVVFLSLAAPAYVAPYSTPEGQLALALVLLIFGFGFRWMRKLASHRKLAPFLARPGQVADPADAELVAALTAKLYQGGVR